MLFSMVCPSCANLQDVKSLPNQMPQEVPCTHCGTALVFADPTAAVDMIARAAIPPVPPTTLGRTIRREVLIGLAWGLALSVFVVYPLRVQGAYRDSSGQIHLAYTSAPAFNLGEDPPARFALG
jgi:hypothetical protein